MFHPYGHRPRRRELRRVTSARVLCVFLLRGPAERQANSLSGAFGFQPARQWGLHDEYQGGDAFQALEIRPDSIPRGAGLIRYAPEFNAFTSEG